MDRIEIPARTEDEPRYLVIGRIESKWVGYYYIQEREGADYISTEIAERGDGDL